MSNIQEELQFSLKLLKQEWEEDLQQYQEKFLNASISDKKKDGVCWYPVRLKNSKIGFGDRVLIDLERFDISQSHAFQSGKSVSIFSTHDYYQGQEYRLNGVINTVRKESMVVTIQTDDVPDWLMEGKIGIDLLFDEASYREMESTLKAVIKSEKGRLSELKEVLLGEKMPEFSNQAFDLQKHLNPVQNEALALIFNAQDVAIIHGPPGTGKTTTLIGAIVQALKQERQVLVCAPSNAAVDLLVEKLLDQNISTLRIGHPARVDDKILEQTIDAKIAAHDSYKDFKKLQKSADEYKKIGKKFKRNFGHEERQQRKRLLTEARRMREDAESLKDYIMYDIFQKTQVITSTLVGASNPALKGMKFPMVFIDEAGQGLEAATWIPILKAQKVVMAGDHCQLPPTIKSFEAAKKGLSETLFEKAIKRNPAASKMLVLQYRMPEVIMGFSSMFFYQNGLVAAENTKTHYLDKEESILEFIDTAGSGFVEQIEPESLSKLNPEEAKFTLQHLEDLIKRIGIAELKMDGRNIGLISPYRAQVRKFQELIFESYDYPNLRAYSELLTIDSIDGFQGQERDIIVISLVRSNAIGEIGFLSDTRRMNVALTRAKRKLIVIGDSATLSSHDFYNAFMDYVEKNGAYRSVYEYLG